VAEKTDEKQGERESGEDQQQGSESSGQEDEQRASQQSDQDGDARNEGEQASEGAAKGGGAGALGFLKRGRRKEDDGHRSGRGSLAGALALLGRLIATALSILAAIIVLAILVKVFGANRENVIVENLIAAGQFLVGPLDRMFTFASRDTEVAVNWGIAAALYLIVGAIVGRVLGR
jgi:hypothetical protein